MSSVLSTIHAPPLEAPAIVLLLLNRPSHRERFVREAREGTDIREHTVEIAEGVDVRLAWKQNNFPAIFCTSRFGCNSVLLLAFGV